MSALQIAPCSEKETPAHAPGGVWGSGGLPQLRYRQNITPRWSPPAEGWENKPRQEQRGSTQTNPLSLSPWDLARHPCTQPQTRHGGAGMGWGQGGQGRVAGDVLDMEGWAELVLCCRGVSNNPA